MRRKRALVVDDSKSARMVLRKMLEKHDIDVDAAESAEAAMDYLLYQHPDVIFMDHMMPGMDGFQAVKEIKGDPRTATIPVLMYTSKEGEVYVGEARALGAMGVLPKEVKQADVVQVLEKLHLLPDQEAPMRAAAANEERISDPRSDLHALAPEVAAIAREAAEDAIQQFLSGMLDDFRGKLRKDLKDELSAGHEPVHPEPEEDLDFEEEERSGRRIWPAAVAVVALVVVLAGVYVNWRPDTGYDTAGVAEDTGATLNGAPSPQPAALNVSAEAEQERATIQAALEDARAERTRLIQTLGWALNQSGRYEYGEPPFGEERLGLLSELLTRLAAVDFQGTVRMEAHVGRFCLVQSDTGELIPADPQLPIGQCSFIGVGPEQAKVLAGQQSLSFANFLSSSPLLRDGEIDVQLVARGEDMPRYEYPYLSPNVTAGQWNDIARQNNRVEVTVVPEDE